MRPIAFILPILLATSSFAFSQKAATKANNKNTYYVVDLSKSLPANHTHDRYALLTIHSADVALPKKISKAMDDALTGDIYQDKYDFVRRDALRVLVNPSISPEDKQFICRYHLEDRLNKNMAPIFVFLEQYLKKGSLN